MSDVSSQVLNTIGPLYFGVLFATLLYGVTVVQTWLYFISYARDPWHIKALVISTFFTDTAHQTLISVALYQYTILNFNNPDILSRLLPANTAELFPNALTALLVKSFFIFRIYTLSAKNMYLTILNIVLLLAEFGVTVSYGIVALNATFFMQLAPHKLHSSMIVVMAAASDIVIAAELAFLLYRSRQTSFGKTRALINKLLLFVLNTGILTSMCAIAVLVTILVLPNSLVYIGLYHILGRLYINSLLATLNARDQIRQSAFDPTSVLTRNTTTRLHSSRGSDTRDALTSFGDYNMFEQSRDSRLEVKVDTTVARELDGEYSPSEEVARKTWDGRSRSVGWQSVQTPSDKERDRHHATASEIVFASSPMV